MEREWRKRVYWHGRGKRLITTSTFERFGKVISFQDIEITNDELGRPIVELSDSVNARFDSPQIILSISHCKEYANAVALWLD